MKSAISALALAVILLFAACSAADSSETPTSPEPVSAPEPALSVSDPEAERASHKEESADERSEEMLESFGVSEESAQISDASEGTGSLRTVEAEGFYMDVPADWQKNQYGAVTAYELDGRSIGFHTIVKPENGEMSSLKDYYETYIEHGNITSVSAFYDTVGPYNRLHMTYEGTGSGAGYTFEMMLIDVGDYMVMFNTQYSNDTDGIPLRQVLDSIRMEA